MSERKHERPVWCTYIFDPTDEEIGCKILLNNDTCPDNCCFKRHIHPYNAHLIPEEREAFLKPEAR
jgi:hypothetical protein